MSVQAPTEFRAGVPVTFPCEGYRLVGSLHPTDAPARYGVILLNQGPVDRGGSHRLYIKLANRLSSLGVPVLRFDARGVGESGGMWEGEDRGISIFEVYGHIQRGAWKPDTLAAIDYMLRQTGVERVVLGGLCGGAVTAIFAGAEHPAVHAMFVIGTPVTFSAVTRRTSDLPDAIIARESASYVRKLVRLSSWKRFFSFQTDYRTLVHVFLVQVVRRWQRVKGVNLDPSLNDENVNIPLFKAMDAVCRRGKRLLVIFGENDYLWQEFQEHLPRFGKDRTRLPFELVTIPDANHTLTEDRWQETFFTTVHDWIGRLAGRNRLEQPA